MFEGIYFNGKKWTGKGKEYNEKGILEFEGEYLNGKRWFGKLYDKEGYLRFDGQYLSNGKKLNGIGREY